MDLSLHPVKNRGLKLSSGSETVVHLPLLQLLMTGETPAGNLWCCTKVFQERSRLILSSANQSCQSGKSAMDRSSQDHDQRKNRYLKAISVTFLKA